MRHKENYSAEYYLLVKCRPNMGSRTRIRPIWFVRRVPGQCPHKMVDIHTVCKIFKTKWLLYNTILFTMRILFYSGYKIYIYIYMFKCGTLNFTTLLLAIQIKFKSSNSRHFMLPSNGLNFENLNAKFIKWVLGIHYTD